MVWLKLTCGFHGLGWHGTLFLWWLVAPPIHTTRVAVISSVAVTAVEVATKATCEDKVSQMSSNRTWNQTDAGGHVFLWVKHVRPHQVTAFIRNNVPEFKGLTPLMEPLIKTIWESGLLTSTEATVSSMASSVTASTVATEASRTRRLTVVPSTKTTREPAQEPLLVTT